MRLAVRYHELGVAPRLDEVEDPTPGEDDVSLEVRRSSLTHLDRTVASGSFALHPPLPYVGGVEGIGTVDGVRHLVRGRGVGLKRDGCWTTRMVVPRDALLPLPDGIDDDSAVVFFGPASTAARAVDVGRIQAGQRVVVTGAAGAVGSLTAQMCQRAGAHVVGVVSRAASVDAAAGDEVVVGRGEDVVRQLDEAPDVLIDTVGGQGAVELLMAVRPGGTAVMVGYTAGREMTLHLPSWLLQDVAIVPVNMVRAERWARERFADIAARFAAGELTIRTERIGLADVPAGLERLAAGGVAGRLVVDPWA
jgi:NADPH2:quinone reductase